MVFELVHPDEGGGVGGERRSQLKSIDSIIIANFIIIIIIITITIIIIIIIIIIITITITTTTTIVTITYQPPATVGYACNTIIKSKPKSSNKIHHNPPLV